LRKHAFLPSFLAIRLCHSIPFYRPPSPSC
jgi:hypothetical protein